EILFAGAGYRRLNRGEVQAVEGAPITPRSSSAALTHHEKFLRAGCEFSDIAADKALIPGPKPLIFAENVIYCGQIDENSPPSIALPFGSLFFRRFPKRTWQFHDNDSARQSASKVKERLRCCRWGKEIRCGAADLADLPRQCAWGPRSQGAGRQKG